MSKILFNNNTNTTLWLGDMKVYIGYYNQTKKKNFSKK